MKVIIVLSLLVVSVDGMSTRDCTEWHVRTIRSFFNGLITWPFNLKHIVTAVKTADDWQICEHELLPRICVLDIMYEQALNKFSHAKSFEADLKKISVVAKVMENKCNTRNMEPGKTNNL